MIASLGRGGIVVGVVLSALSRPCGAEESRFDLSADLRVRGEADDRSFLEEVPYRYTIFQRTRVRLDVKGGEGAGALVEIQDSRRWGDEHGTQVDLHDLDLHQGFLRFHPGAFVRVDLGRQEIRYAHERVIGDSDFDNVGRTFDALKVHTDMMDGWWDVLAAKVDRSPDPLLASHDESVTASFFHHDFSNAGVGIEPFVLYRDDRSRRHFELAYGGAFDATRGQLSLAADVVLERARVAQRDARGYLVGADLAWSVSPEAAADSASAIARSAGGDAGRGVSLGFTRYSGRDPKDATDHTYDPLFSDDHPFFGILDVADTYANTLRAGLSDYHVSAWTTLSARVSLRGTGSVFRTVVASDLGTGFDGGDLGEEIDLVLRARLLDGLVLEAGSGYFLRGDLIRTLLGDQNGTWGYLQASGSF